MAYSHSIEADSKNYSAAEAFPELEEAFGPAGDLREQGPWSGFFSLAAWVEHVHRPLAEQLERAKNRLETYAEASERRSSLVSNDRAQRAVEIEVSRLDAENKRFLATAGPTGVTYGAILDEAQARRGREDLAARAAETITAPEEPVTPEEQVPRLNSVVRRLIEDMYNSELSGTNPE